MSRTKCPKCGGWGTSALINYCKRCYPYPILKSGYQVKRKKSVFNDFTHDFSFGGTFDHPAEFGIVKDKFGVEDVEKR